MKEIEIESAFMENALELLLTDTFGNPLQVEKVVITEAGNMEAVYYKFDEEYNAYVMSREHLGEVYGDSGFKLEERF